VRRGQGKAWTIFLIVFCLIFFFKELEIYEYWKLLVFVFNLSGCKIGFFFACCRQWYLLKMRGRSYSYSPSPPRGYGRKHRSPSPRGRHGGRGRDLPTSLLVRNLRLDCRFGFSRWFPAVWIHVLDVHVVICCFMFCANLVLLQFFSL